MPGKATCSRVTRCARLQAVSGVPSCRNEHGDGLVHCQLWLVVACVYSRRAWLQVRGVAVAVLLMRMLLCSLCTAPCLGSIALHMVGFGKVWVQHS